MTGDGEVGGSEARHAFPQRGDQTAHLVLAIEAGNRDTHPELAGIHRRGEPLELDDGVVLLIDVGHEAAQGGGVVPVEGEGRDAGG